MPPTPDPSPFELDLGTYQGRIGPGRYELGHALAGQWVKVAAGDSNSVEQYADWTTAPIVRAQVDIIPRGGSWTLTVTLDGDEYVSVPVTGIARTLADIAVPQGGSTLAFVLACGADAVCELPSVQVRYVVSYATDARAVVANRTPEPGEIEVPVGQDVSFDVLTTSTEAVDHHDIAMYVDGVLASPSTGPLPDGLSVHVDWSHAAWLPFTTHTVRVIYPGLDVSWSFRTVDTIGPSVVSAVALDERLVQVTFSETLASVDGTYTIVLVSGAPAVTPDVLSAVALPDGSALLTLSTEQTPRAVYRVTVFGVTDMLGNAIVGTTATWVGYQPPQPDGRDFDLYSMLLESDRSQDVSGDLRQFVACYQEVTNLLLTKIDRLVATVVDPDTASEVWLDAMLRDLGNPFGFDMTLGEKRKLVQLLVAIYKLKGTDQGIVSAVRLFLGVEVTISTPWRSGWVVGVDTVGVSTVVASGLRRDLYSYNIVSPIALTDEQRARIVQIARYMQRLVCHLREIVEPAGAPVLPDHWQVGLSRVGIETLVH